MECLVWDHAWQNHQFLLFCWEDCHHKHKPGYVAAVCCASTPWWNNLPARWDSTTVCQHCLHILRGTIPCNMDQKTITIHHMACHITRPNTTWFFPVGAWIRSTGHQYVIWQTYKKEFMLLSTMSFHRWFITHGARLNTSWTFTVPLMEAILWFMEHMVKNPSFRSL